MRGRIDGRPSPPANPTCVEPGYDVRLTVDSLGRVHVAAHVGNRYLRRVAPRLGERSFPRAPLAVGTAGPRAG